MGMSVASNNLMTTAEVAEELGVTEVRVRQLCQERRLGQEFGDRWLITREELEQFKRIPRITGRPKRNRQ